MKSNSKFDIETLKKDIIKQIKDACDECFGVLSLMKEKTKKGTKEDLVKITFHDDLTYSVDVHVVLAEGIKITEVLRSAQKNIKFHLKLIKEMKVNKINIFADAISTK